MFKFHTITETLDLGDISKSAADVAKGVIEKIPDAIPKPEDIFQAGKNLIAGYPFQQVNFQIFFFCFLLRHNFTKSLFFYAGFFCHQHIL